MQYAIKFLSATESSPAIAISRHPKPLPNLPNSLHITYVLMSVILSRFDSRNVKDNWAMVLKCDDNKVKHKPP